MAVMASRTISGLAAPGGNRGFFQDHSCHDCRRKLRSVIEILRSRSRDARVAKIVRAAFALPPEIVTAAREAMGTPGN